MEERNREDHEMIDSITKEADSKNGTWSLTTYSKVRSTISKYNSEEMEKFLICIFNRIDDCHGSAKAKFKYSQLLSSLFATGNIVFIDIITKFEDRINSILNTIEHDSLGAATIQLLQSMTQKDGKKIKSQTPPPLKRIIEKKVSNNCLYREYISLPYL